jgi:ABC-2 type transport system ATP-binding protein
MIKETAAAEFTRIGYRKVSLETASELNLASLEGVAGLQRDGHQYRFLYSGKPDDLIRLLGGYTIASISIEEPDLESVFMHYFNHSS